MYSKEELMRMEQPELVKLIDEGKLTCQPCKVGDKVWLLLEKLTGGYDIVESKCIEYRVRDSKTGPIKFWSMFFPFPEIDGFPKMEKCLDFDRKDFGETVFLTPEEADQKLKEMTK